MALLERLSQSRVHLVLQELALLWTDPREVQPHSGFCSVLHNMEPSRLWGSPCKS